MNTEANNARPGEAAISLWEKLTGRKVDALSSSIGSGEFSLYDANKRITAAIKTGDEAIVTLLIRSQVPRFARAATFPLSEYRSGSERITGLLETMDRLDALFAEPSTARLHDEFQAYAEGSLAFYRGVERSALSEETRAFVSAEGGSIGLDALQGLDRLTRLMIQDGIPAPASGAKLGRHIYQISKIEDLLHHAKQIPTGFSLCVIRGQNIASSYFVMVVRTGTRILALTDKGKFSHPLQEELMQARNDRFNAYRIDGSHFPYSLLKIEWLDRERVARESEPRDTSLPAGTGLAVLAEISELDDRELLWLQLFIEQCQQRYFHEGQAEPLLATGSMLAISNKLASDDVQYPVPVGRQLALVPRASKDLTAASFHESDPGWFERTNPNLWMEQRFAEQVPEECLYIPESVMKAGQLQIGRDVKGELIVNHGESRKGLFVANLKSIPLNSLDTPERIIADAHYTARHNQVEIIKGLAAADYKLREQDMKKWFYKAVAKNLPALLDDLLLANHARFRLPRTESGQPTRGVAGPAMRYISYIYEARARQHAPDPRDQLRLEHVIGVTNRAAVQWDCYLQPGQHVPANLFITLSTETIYDIVALTGLELSQIPPELHTRGLSIYTGNHILSRLDPLSGIDNPWDRLRLRFRVPVSFKAFKAYRAERGLTTPAIAALEEWAREGGHRAHSEGLDPCRLLEDLVISPVA
ncbi:MULTISPECIES: hypothetical protein [Pseudomonas]|uniref:Uncharacterized protein n=2 Tax=Pseudomonas TaxID=286 RepID=A0AAJ5V4C2_9PSED|nr:MULTISPECIES: hypothetical protein [Pseudomonas]MCT8164091.1 hypothetical protein [Pseudomonas sp. HD6422]MCT8182921.1 hypothetical protein [Pseudomonas sp. HD6421]MDH1930392.1 hypothetical protein [Pseudomonas sp. GD03696]MDM1711811.1 hypothetical protein [Pseudomonas sp. 165]ORL53110.1 hypothetical protein B7H18_03770 [Pseudomonas putida]